jgi:hypothetical protein
MEIVGIVDDIREGPLDVAIPPVLYTPFNQQPDNDFTLVVRTVQSEAVLLPAITALVHQIDPGIVSMRGTTMTARGLSERSKTRRAPSFPVARSR